MVERLLRNYEVHGSTPGLDSRAHLPSISLVRYTGSHWGYSQIGVGWSYKYFGAHVLLLNKTHTLIMSHTSS